MSSPVVLVVPTVMQALDDRALAQVADYFRALAEPLRLKLLNALREGPLNVTELTTLVGSSQANVSKHLSQLAKCGLVRRSARGTSVFYEIADPRTYELCELVCGQITRQLVEQVQGMGQWPHPGTGTGEDTQLPVDGDTPS
jgi:DNA-binding transcriptional ArsR family regulator